MKIVCISDTHCKFDQVVIPECDLLISCGDYSFHGEQRVVKKFHEWMDKQPARHKISVQGNHETAVEKNFQLSKEIAEKACHGVHFIDEGLVDIEGKKIWCSSVTPFFGNWAWNRHPGADIQRHWDRIPEGIDVLATHGPPDGILDEAVYFDNRTGTLAIRNCGCPSLLKKILEVKPKAHIFGHIHPGYGELYLYGIQFINAALLDDRYELVNKPIVFTL